MKAEAVKKIADQALTQLSEALKAGKSQHLTQYLSMLAKFHRYSYGNVLLIFSQMSSATNVAGFHAWKQMGRFVKKGEKGIAIIAPMAIRTNETSENNRPDATSEAKAILRFRAVYVFDVTQTEGEPLPEPSRVEGDPQHHLGILRQVVAERGIALDHDDVPPGADGVSRGGRISIRASLSPAAEFSVLAHEFAHELLHHGANRPASKTVRKTEAEAVAFVVSQAIGLNTGSSASDYIQLYEGNAETLALSLGRIQQVAADIIFALRRESMQAIAA
ncbi:MAG: ArdC-like ssDNA-binding domain-containing protein [Phycisphaerales bacterium]